MDQLVNIIKGKRWIVFSIIAIILIVVLILFFYLINNKNDSSSEGNEPIEKVSAEEDDEESNEEGATNNEEFVPEIDEETGTYKNLDELDSEDELARTKAVTELLYMEHIAPLGTNKEYPKGQASTLRAEILELATRGEYGEIMNEYYPYINQYRFSEKHNLGIAGMFHDVSSIIHHIEENGIEDTVGFAKTVKNSYTPEMLLIGTVYTPLNDRRYIVTDPESLTPLNDFEYINIIDTRTLRFIEDVEDEETFGGRNIAREIMELKKDTNSIYVFDFELKNLLTGSSYLDTPFTAYIREDLYGNLSFYGMYIPDGVENYTQSVAWWMQHDPIFIQAREKVEQLEEEHDGKITMEEINKLFESGY